MEKQFPDADFGLKRGQKFDFISFLIYIFVEMAELLNKVYKIVKRKVLPAFKKLQQFILYTYR